MVEVFQSTAMLVPVEAPLRASIDVCQTNALQAKISQRWMVDGSAAEWPIQFTFVLFDRRIVDARDAATH